MRTVDVQFVYNESQTERNIRFTDIENLVAGIYAAIESIGVFPNDVNVVDMGQFTQDEIAELQKNKVRIY
jgi:hypothetical protein